MALKGVLKRWQLVERISDGARFMATEILTPRDKDIVASILFDKEDRITKRLLVGDVILLTSGGFVVESFIPFRTRYQRL